MRTPLTWLTTGAVILMPVGCIGDAADTQFASAWRSSPDRPWAGPNYWANRLQDWEVRNGKLRCIIPGPMRTVHLLTRRLVDSRGKFTLSVRTGAVENSSEDPATGSAGFLIGAGRDLDYRAASLIHHSHGEAGGLYIGIDTRGRLFVRDFEQEEELLALGDDALSSIDSVTLRVRTTHQAGGYSIRVTAIGDDSISLYIDDLDPERILDKLEVLVVFLSQRCP